MSLLRVHGSIADMSQRCQWALLEHGRLPVTGEGRRAELPRRAEHVQLVIPAAQMMIARVRLPPEAKRRGGAVLAFAVEEQILGEPDETQAILLGTAEDAPDGDDLLAVVDKQLLRRWRTALDDAGIRNYELYPEIFLLPRETGEWSLAWTGREGFVRSGEREGAATDCGDRDTPPLSLHLMLEEAAARGMRPTSIALYATQTDTMPDARAWQRSLDIPVRCVGVWDWRLAPEHAGIVLAREKRRWSGLSGLAIRLRPAAMIAVGALAIHASASIFDWMRLAREHRELRQGMEAQFRALFPDAVAVVDPALQMRRKLAEARHAAGLPDDGDFLPLIAKVAAETGELPAGSLRAASYESGRLTLDISGVGDAAARQLIRRLQQAGLSADLAAGGTMTAQGKSPDMTIVVRAL